jgi:hypothetical protein
MRGSTAQMPIIKPVQEYRYYIKTIKIHKNEKRDTKQENKNSTCNNNKTNINEVLGQKPHILGTLTDEWRI